MTVRDTQGWVAVVCLLSCLSAAGGREGPLAEEQPGKRGDSLKQQADHLARLHRTMHTWLARDLAPDQLAFNQDYADLIVAFGLARLGQTESCRALLRPATGRLDRKDEVHRTLSRAFGYRIEQLLEGQPHTGSLPAVVFRPITDLEARGEGKIQRYSVDRMRNFSRILEPQERVDPYLPWAARVDGLMGELAALQGMLDREVLEKRIRQWLEATQGEKTRLSVLAGVLPLTTRVGEKFAVELLGQVVPLLQEQKDTTEFDVLVNQAALLERALALAADIKKPDLVKDLAGRAAIWLEARHKEARLDLAVGLADQALSTLSRMKMREEALRLLGRVNPLLPRGKDLEELRSRYGSRWSAAVRTLLNLASGWISLGKTDKATPVLNEARTLLFPPQGAPAKRRLAPVACARLACSYVAAVGRLPLAERSDRLAELFNKMEKLPDTFTTSKHFSLLHLMILEAAVLGFARSD
jgi:cellulose synthase operon protein C